ncbi:MAG: cytochrome c-550 PedF [Rhodospirillales bacterium]|nr:cytochrome c-550 PedF [Rhodospirillales bacterium]MDH3911685.1 cytochrome c-550 PedF [Rhodospirillales bacterium]MDH3968807.1 cytochrome c-550 PedF [Rhodospirillales bacterium]
MELDHFQRPKAPEIAAKTIQTITEIKRRRSMKTKYLITFLAVVFTTSQTFGHADVAPQPVNTDALPDVGEEWREENPYRAETAGEEVWKTAIEIGASGYNQNCARCHGLEAVSGGLAPDLRYLEANLDGDEWYTERYRNGYTVNGITKMPGYDELLGQKAAWAIRTYIETRPDDGALDDFLDQLATIRDDLKKIAERLVAGTAAYADISAKVDTYKAVLREVANQVSTASGAPAADSAASRAYTALDASAEGVAKATEFLTVGLSVAQ